MKAITGLDCSSKLIPFFQLIEVNELHLTYLAPWLGQDGNGIEVGMKDIPKPIVNAQKLVSSIRINLSSFTCPFPTLSIVNSRVSNAVLWSFEDELIIIVPHIAVIKLRKVVGSVGPLKNGMPDPLISFLLGNILLMCCSVN
jgi:hypothetical protein